jgi:hypothetical protein
MLARLSALRRRFEWLDWIFTRIEAYTALLEQYPFAKTAIRWGMGVVMLAWTWLFESWLPLAIVSGLGAVVVLNHLAPRSDGAATPKPAVSGADQVEFEGRVSDPSLFDPKGLYVAKIVVEGPNTLPDLYLRIGFLLFNATGRTISMHPVEGTVAGFHKVNGEPREFEALPPPRLEIAEVIPAFNDRCVMLEQRLPREAANAIVQTLANLNDVIEFHLGGLGLFCSPAGTDEKIRIPVWDKITVKKTTDIFFVARVVEGTGHATIGASVSL